MIEKMEAEYDELLQKLRVIENDKAKIEVWTITPRSCDRGLVGFVKLKRRDGALYLQSVIEELDTKKNEALETTWVKVKNTPPSPTHLPLFTRADVPRH